MRHSIAGSRAFSVLLVIGAALGGAAVAFAEEQRTDPQIVVLMRERADTLKVGFADCQQQYHQGTSTLNLMLQTHASLRAAELELAETPRQRIAILEEAVKTLLPIEKIVHGLFVAKARGGSLGEYAEVKAARLEAEIALRRERLKAKR